MKVPLTVWERRLLKRTDYAVLAVVNARIGGKGKDRIDIRDGKAVLGLFKGLKDKKNGGKPK